MDQAGEISGQGKEVKKRWVRDIKSSHVGGDFLKERENHKIRGGVEISSPFGISSSGRLCPIFKHEIFKIATAIPPVFCFQVKRIQPQSERRLHKVILAPSLREERMAQEKKDIPLGDLELYPYPGMYIADVLKEHGVEMAFGVHGGHIWTMLDAMSKAGIRNITVRHEQAAVYAAEAYSKITGKPGIAFATVGPGGANTVAAIQQAHLSNSPVILLLGGHEPEHDGLFNTIQESYATDLFPGITKWVQRVVYPNQFKGFLSRAFKIAQTPPRGPVVLEFTASTLLMDTNIAKNHLGWMGAMGEHVVYLQDWRGQDTPQPLSPGSADPADIEKLVKLLYNAEKPIIIAADGAHWSGSSEELVEVAELSQVVVTNRRIGRGVVPETHPLFIKSRVVGGLLRESDLLIIVGMKVGFFDGFGGGWPKCVQISESADQIWNYIPTELAMVGSPKLIFKQMTDYIRANNLKPPASRPDFIKTVQETHQKSTDSINARAEKYKDRESIHGGYLCKVIWDTIEDLYEGRNRVMVDGYSFSGYIPHFIQARYSGQIMDASENAGVGHGVGMAIGAAFADPETIKTPVVALMGDAGMGVSGMDIETAARHKLPIVFIVWNNNGWLTGMKHSVYGPNWEGLGEQDREFGNGEFLPNIRYDKMFEVIGCHSENVEDPKDIRPALERAFRAAENGKPAVVNCKIDPACPNPNMYVPAMALSWILFPNRLTAPYSVTTYCTSPLGTTTEVSESMGTIRLILPC